ncbi:HAMP domain-containing sensor histidine kinase, partial [uncultured Halomonas sp.]|uniref:sensor histidine kinase n=1 Tax=uncultured Halomonas sp. TaxID=173971 RepID=UPI00260B26A2
AEFVSTVSHELRTPLTAIRGALGMLAQGMAGPLPEDARSLVTVADKNGGRLSRLIDDILDMEKLEAGQLVMQPTRLSLAELVAQAIADNGAFAESFQVRFAWHGPLPADGQVMVDPDRFAQVMANLLSNAIKHSPAGGEVRVEVGSRTHAGREGLEVAVVDRGQGIPLAFQPRVFERFAQADGSDRRRTGGTGLGLAITRRLVVMMQGQIDFVSVPGEGTRFRVWLPRAPAPSESTKEERP